VSRYHLHLSLCERKSRSSAVTRGSRRRLLARHGIALSERGSRNVFGLRLSLRLSPPGNSLWASNAAYLFPVNAFTILLDIMYNIFYAICQSVCVKMKHFYTC